MQNFSLSDFSAALTYVSQDHELTGIKAAEVGNVLVEGSDLDRVANSLRHVSAVCERHQFDGANKCLRRIAARQAAGELTWVHLRAELWRLYEALEDDCREHYFYKYPSTKVELLLSAEKDWGAALKAFPSAKKDVISAVDCYALGHDHASIYHSMTRLSRWDTYCGRRA